MRKPFIAGNWKMNTTLSEALELTMELRRLVSRVRDVEIAVLPPYPYLTAVGQKLEDSNIALGAQDLYTAATDDGAPVDFGARTSMVSGPMLESVGCKWVAIGHSERRQFFGDTDVVVGRKVKATLAAGLNPILCVGEHLEERESGRTLERVETQIREGLRLVSAEDFERVVVAYEPVWAIGTGKVATVEQAQEVHAYIRKLLGELYGVEAAAATRIQYGGSVKPSNVAGLMAMEDVDGALVGGAALNAESFSAIVRFREQR